MVHINAKRHPDKILKKQFGFRKGEGGSEPGRTDLFTTFVTVLAKDFKEHGEGTVRIARIEEPLQYLRLIQGLLPREFIMSDTTIDDMSDSDLLDALKAVREAKAITKQQIAKAKAKVHDG